MNSTHQDFVEYLGPEACDEIKAIVSLDSAKSATGAAGSKGRVRRQLGRRSTDEATQRSIAEHFPDFDQSAIDLRIVNGRSLREQINEDIIDDKSYLYSM